MIRIKNQGVFSYAEKYSDRGNPRAFNKAPKIIIFNYDLTPTEKTFYLILQDYQWRRINPTQQELAETLNCSERNIRKLASKLKEAGLIKIMRTGRANRYHLTDLETTEQASTQPATATAVGGEPAPRLSRNSSRSQWRASAQVEPQQSQPAESQPEQSSSNQPEIFLPTIAETECQSDRNSNSGFELDPINKINKESVCSILGDIPQRDMTGVKNPSDKPKKGSRVLTLVGGADETALGVQGSKSPASVLFSKPADELAPTKKIELELDEKQRNFVKVYDNLLAFGFSEVPAQQILELAYKKHGDQAGDYLNNWAERINNYSWVINPQGYMRRAVAENWNIPKHRQQRQANSDQARQRTSTSTTTRSSRPAMPQPAKNFQQYIEKNTNSVTEPQPQPSDSATESATTTALDFAANWALTSTLKQLDSTAAQRFKCFALAADGQSLVARFYGIIPTLDLELLLATVKIYYPQIERVLIQG